MAIKIRRRSYDQEPERNIELDRLWAQRSDTSRFGLGQVRVAITFEWSTKETPLEPYHQIDAICSSCQLRAYRSANDIDLCLACGRPVDDFVAAPPRRPFSRPRKTKTTVTRTFKVKPKKPALPPPPPSWTASLPDHVREAVVTLSLDKASMTVELVRKRRQDLALTHHPDIGGDTNKFASINAAADLLISYLLDS